MRLRVRALGVAAGVGIAAWVAAVVPGCASLAGPGAPAPVVAGLRIVAPHEGAVLGDGNLFRIEGIAIDAEDGRVDRVEVAFDFDDRWVAAQPDGDDPARWRYLWRDPLPGMHRIRARAFGVGDQEVVEQSIAVEVRDGWSTAFAIDNPYATPGVFRKGQLHVHSTKSFDGWTSLPPLDLALEYKARGYSFIAITDHDVISRASDAQDGSFVAIPAYESTSESGHMTGLWVSQPASPALPPQERLDHITAQGGMAVLNHPGWRVGWSGADFRTLHGFLGFEIYNGVTSTEVRSERNVRLWHEVLNAKGWANRVWAVAVDDAHEPQAIHRGWVELKVASLTHQGIRRGLEGGAFYATNGPTFSLLGVLGSAITAASPEASIIRFIDQDLKTVGEGPAAGASYQPKGTERWLRVEAVQADGRTAWSQPFWLLFNGRDSSAG